MDYIAELRPTHNGMAITGVEFPPERAAWWRREWVSVFWHRDGTYTRGVGKTPDAARRAMSDARLLKRLLGIEPE